MRTGYDGSHKRYVVEEEHRTDDWCYKHSFDDFESAITFMILIDREGEIALRIYDMEEDDIVPPMHVVMKMQQMAGREIADRESSLMEEENSDWKKEGF